MGKLQSITINKEIKPLYDIEVEDNHNFIANNILVKNSEQYLSRDSLCILSSINMGKFSTNPSEFKKELQLIGHSVNRFLDNVNEYELRHKTYATPHQKLAIEALRRTGAGFTNMEAWLIKQGLEYGSDQGNGAVEEFQKWYNYYLYESSILLGKEKGNFGLFNREKLEKAPFIQRMMGLGLKFETLRNITCSSIAPTGTLTLLFRGLPMSYGIEKAFGPYFWKRTRISGKYEYYFNVPRVVRDIFNQNNIPIPMESDTIRDTWDGKYGAPIAKFIDDNMATLGLPLTRSTELNINNKLDLMCRVQKWVDSSISTTYMLPQDSDWKNVYDFIIEGWRRGLKSIAAYPDQKMYGIVSYIPFKQAATELIAEGIEIHPQNFTPDEIKQLALQKKIEPPKRRPKEIEGDICIATAKGKKFLFFVGLVGSRPYEMFGGELPKHISIKDGKGKMVKVIGDDESKYYTLEVPGVSFDDFGSYFTPDEEAMFRAISYMLQNGDSIDRIAKYLKGCSHREGISSLYSAARRVLLRYDDADSGEANESGKLRCPACEKYSVIHDAGCIKCLECEWSKCE